MVETALEKIIVFDLDGVITSEEIYWDCAGLALHELLYSSRYWNLDGMSPYHPATNAQESRELSREVFPEWLILSFKARALNSNWDTCYAAVSLHLIDLLAQLPRSSELRPFKPWDTYWLVALREQITETNVVSHWNISALHDAWRKRHPFDSPVFSGAIGLELFERLDAYASQTLGYMTEGVFSRRNLFWSFCRDLLLEWLQGDELFSQMNGRPPAQLGKPGCIFFEEPLLPVEQVRVTLSTLYEHGYTLGIASGRFRWEAVKPLEKYELLQYFDDRHVATYDVVKQAEAELREQGCHVVLDKPHPFQFQAAATGLEIALRKAQNKVLEPLTIPSFIAVGDSTSDILSGRAAGAWTVAVLTGAPTPEARQLLLKSHPDFVISDMTTLPELLIQIENNGPRRNLGRTRAI